VSLDVRRPGARVGVYSLDRRLLERTYRKWSRGLQCASTCFLRLVNAEFHRDVLSLAIGKFEGDAESLRYEAKHGQLDQWIADFQATQGGRSQFGKDVFVKELKTGHCAPIKQCRVLTSKE